MQQNSPTTKKRSKKNAEAETASAKKTIINPGGRHSKRRALPRFNAARNSANKSQATQPPPNLKAARNRNYRRARFCAPPTILIKKPYTALKNARFPLISCRRISLRKPSWREPSSRLPSWPELSWLRPSWRELSWLLPSLREPSWQPPSWPELSWLRVS